MKQTDILGRPVCAATTTFDISDEKEAEEIKRKVCVCLEISHIPLGKKTILKKPQKVSNTTCFKMHSNKC